MSFVFLPVPGRLWWDILPITITSRSDPYVVLRVANTEQKTEVLKNTLNPVWQELSGSRHPTGPCCRVRPPGELQARRALRFHQMPAMGNGRRSAALRLSTRDDQVDVKRMVLFFGDPGRSTGSFPE